MGKHKKTRKEKIIADYRHQVYILKNNIPININKSSSAALTLQNPYSNTHVLKDVLKTAILTCSILAAQIILFFLLKRHIITFPGINY